MVETQAVLAGCPWSALEGLASAPAASARVGAGWRDTRAELPDQAVPLLGEDGVVHAAVEALPHADQPNVRWLLAPPDRLARLRTELRAQDDAGVPEPVRRFVAWLLRHGRLTHAGADTLWARLAEAPEPVDRALIAARLMAPDAVAAALAELVEWPLVDLDPTVREDIADGRRVQRRLDDPVDPEVAALVPQEMAERLGALPVWRRDRAVWVAFADPLDETARAELEAHLRVPVRPVVAPRAAVAAAIRRTLGGLDVGDRLVAAGLIGADDLHRAHRIREGSGVGLREALLSLGLVTEAELAEQYAMLHRVPYVELPPDGPDEATVRLIPEELARARLVLPLLRLDDELVLGMVDPGDRGALEEVARVTRMRIEPAAITERSLRAALARVYREAYLAHAALDLAARSPDDSASRVLSRGQVVVGILLLAAGAALGALNPIALLTVLTALSTLFYLSFSGYKLYLIHRALTHRLEVETTPEEMAALEDDALPVYTILVPLYHEAAVLPTLVAAIDRLDYPKPKLDVKLLLEEDDLETIEAVRGTKLPSHFKVVVVPQGQPKGKPKACNYGLIQAQGQYVVIFDAEDIPESDQLKKALVAFGKADPHVACVQAKLNYYNRHQNLLTRWFTTEYSMWFDLFLPGLDASDAPIPLGGTSNHFRTDQLRALGAWDPYNVTEDADLGVRLFKAGGKTVVMDSTTYEEANSELYNWIRQRSRWVKGYVQTWLVHMRHPLRLWRELGPRGFVSFQLVVAGTFVSFLLNPIYWALTALWFLSHWRLIDQIFPAPVYYAGSIGLYVGNFVFTYANVAGCMRRQLYGMVKYAVLSPIYWMLMSVAAWKGVIQLLYKPSYWEKTVHGLYRGAPEV